MLQKCVRRRMPRAAARLARELLEASPADVLRRAAVMSLEDAVLHPLLPAVVWLMMATAKGFQLGVDHKALVIRVLWDLASTHIREDIDDVDGDGDSPKQTLADAQADTGATMQVGGPSGMRHSSSANAIMKCGYRSTGMLNWSLGYLPVIDCRWPGLEGDKQRNFQQQRACSAQQLAAQGSLKSITRAKHGDGDISLP